MKYFADAENISHIFIHPSNYAPVTLVHNDISVTLFSTEEMFGLLRATEIITRVCHESLSSSLLRYGVVAVVGAFTPPVNAVMFTFHPDYRRLANIVPIPKSSKSTGLTKCFRSIALKSSRVKLTGHVVPRCLRSSVNRLDDPSQHVYKSDTSNLEAAVSFTGHICRSSDVPIKSIH